MLGHSQHSMYVCAHTRLEVDMEQMEEKGADSCRSMIFKELVCSV